MALKRTDLERLKAAHLKNQAKQAGVPDRFGRGSTTLPDRREQRRLDRERGLVPFAVKLDAGLANQLRALAQERRRDLNDLVAELLNRGLGEPS